MKYELAKTCIDKLIEFAKIKVSSRPPSRIVYNNWDESFWKYFQTHYKTIDVFKRMIVSHTTIRFMDLTTQRSRGEILIISIPDNKPIEFRRETPVYSKSKILEESDFIKRTFIYKLSEEKIKEFSVHLDMEMINLI
jgi:hypothetical protein